MVSVTNNSHVADLRAYMGKTGNGKTTALLADLNQLNPDRLIVWDYKHEYADVVPFKSIQALYDHVRNNDKFQVSFHVDNLRSDIRKNDFAAICNIAYDIQRVCLVVEELQFVTEPSHAPDEWKRVCTTGRKQAMVVMGTSQRPAAMDKHFLGNCSSILSCGLGHDDDAVTVAKSLPGVTAAELMALVPGRAYVKGRGQDKAEIKELFKA